MRYVKRPSRREISNHLAGLDALANGTTPSYIPKRKGGAQPEGETNKAIAQWRALKPGLVLERNKRRLAVVGRKDNGEEIRVMLGWDKDGSADWIGWQSIVVTPEHVGKRLAVFVGIEAKRAEGGTLQPNQREFIRALSEAGGIAGVARNAEDAERILNNNLTEK